METPPELADRIRGAAERFGSYHLPSGETLGRYFDEYRLAADPALLSEVASQMGYLLPDDAEVVVGVELGGVPLAVALSAASGLPAAFCRRRRKTYGTYRQIEGAGVRHRSVVLVDDVVRSGSQLLRAATVLRQAGASVTASLCVLDRKIGGSQRLADGGVMLRSLLVDEAFEADETA